MLKLKRSQVVQLFVALGVAKAPEWNTTRLLGRAKVMHDCEFDETKIAKNKTLKNLLGSIVTESKKGEEAQIEIEEDVAPEKSAAAPTAPAAPAKKKASLSDDDDGGEAPEATEAAAPAAEAPAKPKGKRPESAGTNGGPGVIASIQEFLTKASKTSPIKKDQILQKLTERFPDRSPESMSKTINVQVPGRMSKEKNMKIVTVENGGGYYVE